ncbi:hypothetical protein DVS77_24200 [Mycolicibacterium moriokaense]|nr:hypothetical protein DVS77_24200 [Mycolicibacterium moriokaense]
MLSLALQAHGFAFRDADPDRAREALRRGRHEPAPTIAGFAFNPITVALLAELDATIAHLREVLGDQTYEALAREGQAMTTAAMVAQPFDQIDHVRAELNAVSK